MREIILIWILIRDIIYNIVILMNVFSEPLFVGTQTLDQLLGLNKRSHLKCNLCLINLKPSKTKLIDVILHKIVYLHRKELVEHQRRCKFELYTLVILECFKLLLKELTHIPEEIFIDVIELVSNSPIGSYNVICEYVFLKSICILYKFFPRGFCLAISRYVLKAKVRVVLFEF